MDHNRAASYIRVFPGDTLTAGHQAESIRRLADALDLTIVREPGDRPQFQRMMEESKSEPGPFGAIIAYDCWRFAAGAANLVKHTRELQDAGVELLCVWDKPPSSAGALQDPAFRLRRAA